MTARAATVSLENKHISIISSPTIPDRPDSPYNLTDPNFAVASNNFIQMINDLINDKK